LFVERNVQQPRLVEIVGQGAGERADQVVAPVLPEFYLQNLDLQHVAGLRSGYRDRTGQDMARQHALVPGVDLVEFRGNVEFAAVRHHFRAAADGVYGDVIAAGNGEDRL